VPVSNEIAAGREVPQQHGILAQRPAILVADAPSTHRAATVQITTGTCSSSADCALGCSPSTDTRAAPPLERS